MWVVSITLRCFFRGLAETNRRLWQDRICLTREGLRHMVPRQQKRKAGLRIGLPCVAHPGEHAVGKAQRRVVYAAFLSVAQRLCRAAPRSARRNVTVRSPWRGLTRTRMGWTRLARAPEQSRPPACGWRTCDLRCAHRRPGRVGTSHPLFSTVRHKSLVVPSLSLGRVTTDPSPLNVRYLDMSTARRRTSAPGCGGSGVYTRSHRGN